MEQPTSPKDLGKQLGYPDGRAVRKVLREGFPDHPPYARWEPLSDEQIAYVRTRLQRA